MSRIGNLPVEIPSGVTVEFNDGDITVKGPKGELTRAVNPVIKVNIEDNEITFERDSDQKEVRSLHGTTRSLVYNMIEGVTEGFKKELELVGVGYRAQMQGKNLGLQVGLSHPVSFEPAEGITIETPSQTQIIISGPSKDAVGELAANIRAVRPPEPYNGKGIRYVGEHVIRKEGKTG